MHWFPGRTPRNGISKLMNDPKFAFHQWLKESSVAAAVLMLVLASSMGFSQGASTGTFPGVKAGEGISVLGLKLCWCPAGKFIMGSPPGEPERRPGEEQVAVTLTRGFWTAKYEVTQGDWKRVQGELPGPLTAELPEGAKPSAAAVALRSRGTT